MRGAVVPPTSDLRRLVHDLGNDLGALRLRLGILEHRDAQDIESHLAAATRLALHAEVLVSQLRRALDDGKPSLRAEPRRKTRRKVKRRAT